LTFPYHKDDPMKMMGWAMAGAIALSFPMTAYAGPVTPQERRDCKADYHSFCNQYALGSDQLRACMTKVSKKLSDDCVRALYQAGEMSRSQAEKLLHD
jgi:hypothetical protein